MLFKVIYMSRVVRKPFGEFPTRPNTNRAVQSQQMARGFRKGIVQSMKQNKALISCTCIEFVQLICYFRIHKMQVFSLFLKKGFTLYILR